MLSEYRSLVACGSKPVSATMNAVRIVLVMSAALLDSARNTIAAATVKRCDQLFVIPAQAGKRGRRPKFRGTAKRGRRPKFRGTAKRGRRPKFRGTAKRGRRPKFRGTAIQWRATKVTGSRLSRGRRENGVTLTDLSMPLLRYFTAALRRSTSTSYYI